MTTNVVCIEGVITGVPQRREMPGGDVIWTFELDTGKYAIPCRFDEANFIWAPGTRVLVVGNITSRYFRVGGATQRRVEVLANVITRGDT